LKAKIQKDKGNFKRNRRYWSFIRTLIESPEGLVEGQIGVTSPEFLFQSVNDETKNLKQVSDDSDAPVPGTRHQNHCLAHQHSGQFPSWSHQATGQISFFLLLN
jgi:hypothetical protein